MNYLFFLAFAPLLIIPFALLNESTAQEETIGYLPEDNDKDFMRLDWRFYVLLSDIGNGDQFLSDFEKERAKEIIKEIDFPVTKKLWCVHPQVGEIYEFFGSYTFQQPVGAEKVKQYFKNNLPLDKIQFGEYYLLWNNHHSSNFHSDIIIEHIQYGDYEKFLQAESDC